MSTTSARTPSPSLWLLLIASAATLWWAYRDARAAENDVPVLQVRGELLDDVRPSAARGEPTQRTAPTFERTADGAVKLDLDHLAFPNYDAPELRNPKGIALPFAALPEAARTLHGERVVASGYAMPMRAQDGTVSQFLLTRFPPGCCFGAMPVADEWLEVTLAAPRAEPFTGFEKVAVEGVLDAGEKLDDQGYLLSLYRMTQAVVTVTP